MYVISTLGISNPQRRTTKLDSEHQQWDIVQLAQRLPQMDLIY